MFKVHIPLNFNKVIGGFNENIDFRRHGNARA
jgi:hypothetical protein